MAGAEACAPLPLSDFVGVEAAAGFTAGAGAGAGTGAGAGAGFALDASTGAALPDVFDTWDQVGPDFDYGCISE